MTCEILHYFHCAKCLEEIPDDITPADYQDISVGVTKYGIQVWCERHEESIIHITKDDMDSIKHMTCDVCDA